MRTYYPALLALSALLVAARVAPALGGQTDRKTPVTSSKAVAFVGSSPTPNAQRLTLLVTPRKTVALVSRHADPEASVPYARDFDKVWQTVHDHLFDTNMNGKDWRHIGEVYRARLSDVKSREAFEDLVNRMLDELHVSHTEYYTSNDVEFYMLPAVMSGDLKGNQVEQIGVMGHRDGQGYVVAAVLDGSPAQAAGIQSGDRLLNADGSPFTSAGSFRGKAGTPVQITLRREGEAADRTVRVTPVKDNVLHAFLEATRKSARILDYDGLHLGYVHLWTMAHSAFKETLEELVLGRLYNADGLIVDMRDGYGGQPWGYGDVFYRPDVRWEEWYHGVRPYIRHTGYGKPIVLLVNGGTRSAKEAFTYQLKTSHRALIVGSRTAGAFLGAGSYPIGSDGLLELAVLGLRLDGNRLEGVGVTPDVVIAPAFPYTAFDRQLAGAQKALAETIRHQSPNQIEQRKVIIN
jgi:carboxyl-terminal processing protease